jgi:hypothetical protein
MKNRVFEENNARPQRGINLKVLRIFAGCLLTAYLSATSLVSWDEDPRSIERWPLPVLGTGPFRDLTGAIDLNDDSGFNVVVDEKTIAVRLDLWSIDAMSSQEMFTFSSGKESLQIRQESGSLFAYVSSPDYSHRHLLLTNIVSGKNQLLFVLNKLETTYLSYNDSTASGTILFKLSDLLHFIFVPSASSQLYSDYGSVHLRVGTLSTALEPKTLFERFAFSNPLRGIVFNTFLLFSCFLALSKLIGVTLQSMNYRKSGKNIAIG